VSSSLSILVVGTDPKLSREIGAALKGLPDGTGVVLHAAESYRQGIEAARSRHPGLVLVEMTSDLRSLTAFVEELAVASPDTVAAAVFHPAVFGHDVSESAVIIEALRSGLRDFLRRPLSSADLDQLLDRLKRRPRSIGNALGRTFAFISNKGGVGKSTLAVNVAAGLAQRHPSRVLLVDASLQLGTCAALLDLQPETTLTDAVRQRQRLDETLVRRLAISHPSGLDVLAAPRDAVEASDINDEGLALVLTLARRAYDYVVVDSFPLMDRILMAILDVSDLTLPVMESVVPTVLGATKLLQLLDSLGVAPGRQRLILNRYSRYAGNLAPTDVAARLGRQIDFLIPYQKKVLIAGNLGRPYIFQAGRLFSAWGRSMHRLIEALERYRPEVSAVAAPTAKAEEPHAEANHEPR
jgi:pilus assembly protein CpaE